MPISNFAFIIYKMNMYCCCLQRYIYKQLQIQNERKSKVPTGINLNKYANFEFRIYKSLI